ncbi:MAG: hypothetical protein HY525_09505 [Betaproteobacteria bacterium]|nr:hypothetical protein [Betaproteobacteria bacterium]
MAFTKQLVQNLERRFGNEISKIFGAVPARPATGEAVATPAVGQGKPAAELTAAQAGYLIGFRDAHSLRNRTTTARAERADRLAAKGISEGQDIPLTDGMIMAENSGVAKTEIENIGVA